MNVYLNKKFVVISLILFLICLAPVRTNALVGAPSDYGGYLPRTIGNQATYEVTTYYNHSWPNPPTIFQDQSVTMTLENGTTISFTMTQGIKFTFTLIKIINRGFEYNFLRTLYIPNKGTFNLTVVPNNGFTFGNGVPMPKPNAYFAYAFPNSKSENNYYSQYYNATNTSYLHFHTSFHDNHFFVSSYTSMGTQNPDGSYNSPIFVNTTQEFNWKIGWLQYIDIQGSNASGRQYEFKTELISSYIPGGITTKGLSGLTVFSILPPLAVIAIIITVRKEK